VDCETSAGDQEAGQTSSCPPAGRTPTTPDGTSREERQLRPTCAEDIRIEARDGGKAWIGVTERRRRPVPYLAISDSRRPRGDRNQAR